MQTLSTRKNIFKAIVNTHTLHEVFYFNEAVQTGAR